jgi:hypothetical protein
MSKPEKTMTDFRGRQVPISYIGKVDRERDRVVRRLFKRAEKIAQDLVDFKVECFQAFEGYIDWLAAQDGAAAVGGVKGNIKLTSFDGTLQVTRMRQDSIDFDERLQMAVALINEYAAERVDGLPDDIRIIIDDALHGANGRCHAGRILGLLRWNINHPKWKQAMDLIRAAIRVASTKEYCRFYRRAPGADYKLMPLDIAAV